MDEHCYIISYDLCNGFRNYDELYRRIKTFHKWGHLTQSTWAIVTNMDRKDIRDYLMNAMDNDDRLIVVQSGDHFAWHNLFASNEWIKENLKK
jgi:hypothetical protein